MVGVGDIFLSQRKFILGFFSFFENRQFSGSHVKIPKNYFKILEEGKNVGKFIFRRNVKIPENEQRKHKNPGFFSEIMLS